MDKRTKRKNNKRWNTKKKYRTKRKRKQREKKRGGARDPFKSRRRNRVAAGLNPDDPDPRIVEQVRLQETEQSENPLAFNILDKFFKEVVVNGWFGRKTKAYELDPTKFGPNNKINVISGHGGSRRDTFFVVPEGLTLYLPVGAGELHHTQNVDDLTQPEHINSYIRVYKEGSLIQEHVIDFFPFYDGGYYRARGLLELDVPHLTVKNAAEANKEILKFLSRHKKYNDLEADRKKKAETGEIRIHLKTYKDVYFENNIDDIIDKSELIRQASRIRGKYYLNDILYLIAEARKNPDSSISGEWFGTFCRSGENIDINKFRDCEEDGLSPLEDFFQGDFHYEGISAKLERQGSLASSDPTINFKKILDEVFEKREQYEDDDFKESFKRRIEGIKLSVDNNEVISLQDVCFVFQMKQKYP